MSEIEDFNEKPLIQHIKNPGAFLILAPLAELTHSGFRQLLDGFGGCDLYFTEMIDAATLVRGGPYESWYRDPSPGGDRLIYQIAGPSAAILKKAALMLSGEGALGIDINMGCSAPVVISKGAGCAWMSKEAEAVRLIEDIRRALPERTSLSAKIRLGEKENREALLRFCRRNGRP